MKRFYLRTGIALLLGILILTGCGRAAAPQVRLGWAGTSSNAGMTYSYSTFDGIENAHMRAQGGETLVLAYAATVTKGTLSIHVQAPSNATVWETTLSEDIDQNQVDLALAESGRYTVLVTGEETGGNLALSWAVQE